MNEERYTIEQIIDAIVQADDEIICAIQYRDREGLEDVLKDYLHQDDKSELRKAQESEEYERGGDGMEMSSEFRKKWLILYRSTQMLKKGRKYEEDIVIKASVKILIMENVFTVDEMKKQALKDYSIIIPKQFIRECVYG